VTADVAHEDNIFFQATNEQSDTIYSVRPSIEAVSQWSRHQLRANVRGNIYKYDKFDQEDNSTYALGATGRIDVLRSTYVNIGGGFEHLVEARYSPTVQQLATAPVEYERAYGSIGASREVNRLRVSGELRYSDWTYDDTRLGVTPVDQSYRDHETTEGDIRVDYAISPALAVYVFGAANERKYGNSSVPTDVDRGSNGWEAALGADFELTDLTRGQLQVGYLTQEYDDPTVGDSSGLAVRGRVEWFPTQLATVTLTAERVVEDTGVIGAAGTLSAKASAQLDYELLRNLIVTARVNWAEDEYSGIDRTDSYTGAMLGLNYLITRNVGVFGQYNFQTRDSKGLEPGVEYDANRIQIGLVLQY
jgi:adhesin HecA-like repeat protein